MKRYLALALAVLGPLGGLALAISAVAAASTQKSYKTKISGLEVKNVTVDNITRPTVEGKLTSSKSVCVKHREVYGTYSIAQDPAAHLNMGPVFSDAHGHFALRTEGSPGSLRKVMVVAFDKQLTAHSFCTTETKTKTF